MIPKVRRVHRGLCLLPLLMLGCADRLLLYPSHRRIDPVGLSRRDIPFRAGYLEAWVARSPGCAAAGPAVFDLELVGNGSRAERAATRAASRWGGRAVEVVAVNWPGYGGSPGPAALGQIAPAGLAAYDAVAATAAGRPVFIYGHSLGTTAALYVAARRPVAGLVLLNPPPLRQLIVGHYGWWNLWLGAVPVAWQVPAELDSLANAPRCHAPAVFITSGRDAVVPPRFQARVFDAYAGPKTRVMEPLAGHDAFPDPAVDHAFRNAIDRLFEVINPPLH